MLAVYIIIISPDLLSHSPSWTPLLTVSSPLPHLHQAQQACGCLHRIKLCYSYTVDTDTVIALRHIIIS